MAFSSAFSSALSPVFRSAYNTDSEVNLDVYNPDDWILVTGLWDDTQIWVNSAVWID